MCEVTWYWLRDRITCCDGNFPSRAVASLTVPGGQEFHFSHSFPKFWSIFLTFPQFLLIFFLILALRVGDLPTRKGTGYATVPKAILNELYFSCSFVSCELTVLVFQNRYKIHDTSVYELSIWNRYSICIGPTWSREMRKRTWLAIWPLEYQCCTHAQPEKCKEKLVVCLFCFIYFWDWMQFPGIISHKTLIELRCTWKGECEVH